MTQEDKQLLLKDLCARSPYGIIINVNGNNERVDEVNPFEGIITCGFQSFDVDECKPYLRPMSSMTEEEEEEFENLLEGIVDGIERWDKPDMCEEYDWLNSHHFDYRGLIKKGIALEAPKEMYK